MAVDRAYNEKRGFIRMRIDTPVRVTAGDQQFTARCKDLSGSGLLLASERPLTPGTEVEVAIEQEGDNRLPFLAAATVARCDPQESEYFIGLSLTAIHE